jgi:FMN-dependent NADH-azoreductase
MKNLLFVKSSLAGADSRSLTIGKVLITAVRAKHGKLKIVDR